MKVEIARTAYEIILRHAETAADVEVCGLLIGNATQIEKAVPASNVAEDSARRFEIDPAALLAEHRLARLSGSRLVGHYHSHPGGQPRPSLRDAANALEEGQIWLIAGDGRIEAFRAVAGGAIAGRFDAVELELV